MFKVERPKGRCEPLRRGFLNSPTTRAGGREMLFLKSVSIGVVIAGLTTATSANSNKTNLHDQYRGQFEVSGFLLRSTKVCPADIEDVIETALDLIAAEDARKLQEEFGEVTKQWMESGASEFNSQVETQGAENACVMAAQLKSGARRSIASSRAARVKQPNWKSIPLIDRDGNSYAYDASSIVVTNDEKGRVSGADVAVRVVQGDMTIRGKHFVLSFDCSGRYRINYSYPRPLSGDGPEGFVGNIACGRARCEIWRRQEGKSVCKVTD